MSIRAWAPCPKDLVKSHITGFLLHSNGRPFWQSALEWPGADRLRRCSTRLGAGYSNVEEYLKEVDPTMQDQCDLRAGYG